MKSTADIEGRMLIRVKAGWKYYNRLYVGLGWETVCHITAALDWWLLLKNDDIEWARGPLLACWELKMHRPQVWNGPMLKWRDVTPSAHWGDGKSTRRFLGTAVVGGENVSSFTSFFLPYFSYFWCMPKTASKAPLIHFKQLSSREKNVFLVFSN